MHRLALIAVLASLASLASLAPPAYAREVVDDPRAYEIMRLKSGVVLPYPLHNLFRGFARCKRGRHTHRALDIGGVGPNWGLGTPIRSMGRAKITHIGLPEEDPKRYGRRDMGQGTVRRGKSDLPRKAEIHGYGTVRFFTENYGRLRTGVMVATKITEGRLRGYEIRYLHLSAVHPSLKRGSVLQPGQELGLMGGTAVQQDPPHLHLAIFNRSGKSVDPGPILGVGSTIFKCRSGRKGASAVRAVYSKQGRKLMAGFKKRRQRVRLAGAVKLANKKAILSAEFKGGTVRADRITLAGDRDKRPLTVWMKADFRPLVRVLTPWGKQVAYKRAKRNSHEVQLTMKPRRGPLILQVEPSGRRPKAGESYELIIERVAP